MSDTWVEKANIYILLISPPGIGKSPTQEVFLQPLTKIEEEEMKEEMTRADKEGDSKVYSKKLRTLDLVRIVLVCIRGEVSSTFWLGGGIYPILGKLIDKRL